MFVPATVNKDFKKIVYSYKIEKEKYIAYEIPREESKEVHSSQ
jgi:hypothetical protein